MTISKWQCPGCGKVLVETSGQPWKERTVDEFHIVRCELFEKKYGIPDYLQEYKEKVRSELGTISFEAPQIGTGSVSQQSHYG